MNKIGMIVDGVDEVGIGVGRIGVLVGDKNTCLAQE